MPCPGNCRREQRGEIMIMPLLGCIADDYTGATDLCSMLVRSGLRVVLCFGIPSEHDSLHDADAVVIAMKSRSIAAADAIEQSLASLRFLQSLRIERFFFKYCSTFDSTPRGNIGPVADGLAEALNVSQLVFCPAFPENGRTVYQGWLFVGSEPLHESGMKVHPLNPMTDSSLVRWLGLQSTRQVHRLPLEKSSLACEHGHYIADAISDADLRRIAEIAREHQLLSGGSAIARHWAEVIFADKPRRGVLHDDITRPRIPFAGNQAVTSLMFFEMKRNPPHFFFMKPIGTPPRSMIIDRRRTLQISVWPLLTGSSRSTYTA